MNYEAVIGLECHAQLLTKSKLFCSCSTRFGDPANVNTCPVCLGLPGALPVLNRTAVVMAIKAALGLNCGINSESRWSRKNYFYPDLPKGYQISQYDRPVAQHGRLGIIAIDRIHIEEDAGKSLHEGFLDSDRYTYLDFNRSGIPLIEIVSAPDIRSSEQAHEYLSLLKQTLEYLEVCDGNMEEGSLRCDANVSVRPAGQHEYGTRTELKNLNSFRYLRRAIDFEINRQIEILKDGGRVVQETRLWNLEEERTTTMRSKEEAHDYRYFPEPDLPLLVVDARTIRNIKRSLPELPESRCQRFIHQYALSEYDARILTTTRALADFFELTTRAGGQPKTVANWIMGELLRLLKEDNIDTRDLSRSPVTPGMLAELLQLVQNGTISGKIAKSVFEEMFVTRKAAAKIVQERDLLQISDVGEIERVIDRVIQENAENVQQYRTGKITLLPYFVGRVMKMTNGKANPQTVDELLRKKLAGVNIQDV